MIQELDLVCSPKEAANQNLLHQVLAKKLHCASADIEGFHILRKSIDARKIPIKINLRAQVAIKETLPPREHIPLNYKNISNAKRVLIIGSGPGGIFAALRCIELGYKPVIIERGSDVQNRRRDLKAINRDNTVNPDSNYCFGEGGAGTYSDGKLYTRSTKRGSVERILDILVHHGAVEDILYEAHPHIGTNKLPRVVQAIRETIIDCGGEVHFNTRMTDLIIKNDLVTGIATQNGDTIEGEALILATGHSARDVFELLHKKKVKIESKPFAMGVRVEHPQELIDNIQYHGYPRGEELPAAAYKLVQQVDGRGVYSFCMCPGGFIVPSATAQNELVVNGMSPSKRDNHFANSGIVVSIEPEDLKAYEKHGPLAGMRYQMDLEQQMWKAGNQTQEACAQRLTDFVKGKTSSTLNESSYIPGLLSRPMQDILPNSISNRLQKGFMKFGEKMRGYYTAEANIIGLESRTSSPVRIPRDRNTFQHPQIKNLFPCGEGAGFAGGIVSAAIDGEKCAEGVEQWLA